MAKGKKTLPTAFGIPVVDDQSSMTAGERGPVLRQAVLSSLREEGSMAQKKGPGNTPLTESQARALASWWSGRYLRLKPQQEGGEPLHGVKLPRALESEAAVIYFWEEVKCLEHRRSSVNPGAPDWVG